MGDSSLESIELEIENGTWNDPNPLGFWVELHGTLINFTFNWQGP